MSKNWIEILKTEKICTFYNDISISTKSITLLAGENTVGKTASCLHITNEAIKNNCNVLYFDTENKLVSRPEPNLLNVFVNENYDGFKNRLLIKHDLFGSNSDKPFNEEHLESITDSFKPKIIIIDSIYTPFVIRYPEPRKRAKMVGEFVRLLREFIFKKGIAVIITTKIGRVVNNRIQSAVVLGGQELLYNCDIKIKMSVVEKQTGSKKVIFDIDNQCQFVLNLNYGGKLELPI